MNIGYVYGGQQFTGLHRDIDIWLHTGNKGCWDKTRGFSYINGYEFYNHVLIHDDVDFVAFLLKFAGMVCRGG